MVIGRITLGALVRVYSSWGRFGLIGQEAGRNAMSTRLLAALGVGVAMLLAVAVLSTHLDGGREAWIPAYEAAGHVGERETVCGEVASTRYASSARGTPTFLNLESPYPNQLFTVLSWGENRPKFDGPPEIRFRDRRICVTGRITAYKGAPQIVVDHPIQIEIQETPGQR